MSVAVVLGASIQERSIPKCQLVSCPPLPKRCGIEDWEIIAGPSAIRTYNSSTFKMKAWEVPLETIATATIRGSTFPNGELTLTTRINPKNYQLLAGKTFAVGLQVDDAKKFWYYINGNDRCRSGAGGFPAYDQLESISIAEKP